MAFGATELVPTCVQGSLETARLLLEAGARRNAESDMGQTALMLAALNGHLQIARLLLEAGAEKDL